MLKTVTKHKSPFIAIIVIFLVCILIFFKIFLKGQYPIPADLLVSFYFPYYSGGWDGYDPWTTHKEMLSADSIRQIYLWKEFAFDQFKKAQFPLWNPYTFSGQPLLANFQSSVYYPFNLFYLITKPANAWILLIVIQPLFAGIFMYLAIRSFKVTLIPSIYASMAFIFSSYIVTWLENGNIIHSYLWLPLAIWAINNYFQEFKLRYMFVLIISLAFSILAGHPQTVIYIYLAITIFWFAKTVQIRREFIKNTSILVASFIFALAITAIQIIPTFDFYKLSPISLSFSKEVFDKFILPYKNLITFFASDFFGHPASNNFWAEHYGDATPYFGVLPLIFRLWAIYHLWRRKLVKFTCITAFLFILAAVPGPIVWLIKTLQIPLLDSTTPARFISISIFFLIILSALGLESIFKKFNSQKFINKFLKFLLVISIIYIFLWLFAILGQYVLEPKEIWHLNLSVTRRNLILPTAMYLSLPIMLVIVLLVNRILKIKLQFLKYLLILGVFTVTLFGGLFYSNKYLPVAPKKYIFPEHPLFDWIKDNAGIDRFYGMGTAGGDYNFPIHYNIYGAEGYDSLRFQRYAELIASSHNDGKVPSSYPRSDAKFTLHENGYRKRLFELLGIKYLLDKEDNPKTGADWHYDRFPNDKVIGIWQYNKFQVYERQNVLPRVFLTTNYQLIENDQEILTKIYDPNFDLTTLLLEENLSLEIDPIDQPIIIPQIIKYHPNEIIITTTNQVNSLLFLSDVYSKDWNVYINGNQEPLLQAHYAFRAVAVPKGEHQVIFKYQPASHQIGLCISSISILILIFLISFAIKRNKF